MVPGRRIIERGPAVPVAPFRQHGAAPRRDSIEVDRQDDEAGLVRTPRLLASRTDIRDRSSLLSAGSHARHCQRGGICASDRQAVVGRRVGLGVALFPIDPGALRFDYSRRVPRCRLPRCSQGKGRSIVARSLRVRSSPCIACPSRLAHSLVEASSGDRSFAYRASSSRRRRRLRHGRASRVVHRPPLGFCFLVVLLVDPKSVGWKSSDRRYTSGDADRAI